MTDNDLNIKANRTHKYKELINKMKLCGCVDKMLSISIIQGENLTVLPIGYEHINYSSIVKDVKQCLEKYPSHIVRNKTELLYILKQYYNIYKKLGHPHITNKKYLIMDMNEEEIKQIKTDMYTNPKNITIYEMMMRLCVIRWKDPTPTPTPAD